MEQTLQPVGLERVLRCQNNCLNKLAGLVAPVMGLFKGKFVQNCFFSPKFMSFLIFLGFHFFSYDQSTSQIFKSSQLTIYYKQTFVLILTKLIGLYGHFFQKMEFKKKNA